MRRFVSMMVTMTLVLTVLVTGMGLPMAQASAALAPVASADEHTIAPDGGNHVENAIIRAILMGAAALWRFIWFRQQAVGYVATNMGDEAAEAVDDTWFALGRTVDNLVGTQTLTWTVVRDAFYRKIVLGGFSRDVATNGAIGLRDFLQSIMDWFL